jgi:hypothetical protein
VRRKYGNAATAVHSCPYRCSLPFLVLLPSMIFLLMHD